jgi:creatinase
MAIFSAGEIERRWHAVQGRLANEDCLVALSFHNSYYLSGLPMLQWGRFSVTILFSDDAPILITPDFERDAASENSPIGDVRLFRDEDGPTDPVIAKLIAEVLDERKVRVAGIEGESLPVSLYRRLEALLPNVRFADRTDAIDISRLTSSAEELVYIRDASRIVDSGMQRVLNLIEPGLSEVTLAREGRRAMEATAHVGSRLNVSCYLQQGERSGGCHGAPGQRTIAPGQIVEVICEAEVEHYQASLERPIIVGKGSAAVEAACETATQSFKAALKAVGPGARFGDVDEAARAILHAAGYDRIATGSGLVRSILHHTGGRTEHGELRKHNDRLLEPNMVITVEPWAIVPGVGGPRHCDVVRVTSDGYELITLTRGGVLRDTDFGATPILESEEA